MITVRVRIVAAVTAALIFSGCEQTARLTAPDSPRFDGGHTFGGGNKVDSASTTITSSGEGAVVNPGGHTFGGGN